MSNLYRKKLQKIYNKVDSIALKGRDNFIEYYKFIDETVEKGDYGAFEQSLYYYYNIDITDIDNTEDVKRKTWEDVLFQTKSSFLKKLKKIYDRKQVYQNSFDIFSTNPNVAQLSLIGPYQIDQITGSYSATSSAPGIDVETSGEQVLVNIINPNIYSVILFKASWSGGVPQNEQFIQRLTISTQSGSYVTGIQNLTGGEYLIQTEERPNYKFLGYNLTITKDTFLGQIREIDTYSEETENLFKDKQYADLTGSRVTHLEVIKGTSSTIIDVTNPQISQEQNLLNRYSLAIDILNSGD